LASINIDLNESQIVKWTVEHCVIRVTHAEGLVASSIYIHTTPTPDFYFRCRNILAGLVRFNPCGNFLADMER